MAAVGSATEEPASVSYGLEQKWLEEFFDNTHAVYQYRIVEINGVGEEAFSCESGSVFSDWEACLDAAQKFRVFCHDLKILIFKTRLDKDDEIEEMDLWCRKDGTVLSVDHTIIDDGSACKMRYGTFDDLRFVFPVSFQKGDILWDPESWRGPVAVKK